MMIKEEFNDIAPIEDEQFPEKMAALVKEPGFEHAVRWVLPDTDYEEFAKKFASIKGKEELQLKIMHPFLEMLVDKYTSGLSCEGIESIMDKSPRTFITNHRDIVLDSAFLNLCLIRAGLQTSEIAIGNNLLIYSWIEDLVRLNKSFIVRRGLKGTHEALEAAKHLSEYIHYCITEKNQSVWIAQREGRAKDSSDNTQESVIKMLDYAGEGSPRERLLELNITPVSITYEFDPNDYLKAREFLLREKDPEFHKSQRDDLLSMETGLLGQKGRVNFSIGKCINDSLREVASPEANRTEVVQKACALINNEIHRGYHIFPINFVAYDRLHGGHEWQDHYSDAEAQAADAYWQRQLEKLEDYASFGENDRNFMLEKMWVMYANPLKNKLTSDQSA
ncbi:MAG: acyltransferase [Muribaculaceae bacterium]|nr:acyltransferase [Muribaculaceae bacterium]